METRTQHRIQSEALPVKPRALRIDFDLYAEGDEEFKKELMSMIIKNIQEFKEAFTRTFDQGMPEIFLRAAHKVKVCVSMLNDKEFARTIKEIERDIIANLKWNHCIDRRNHFNHLCDAIILGLENELQKSPSI